ncbi:hypothetical protein N7486_010530 [Penicillium sp. IBT 16267x]|nr:hypothetical protein N7486_010530 [Penicillium sp. IBT 16267x]
MEDNVAHKPESFDYFQKVELYFAIRAEEHLARSAPGVHLANDPAIDSINDVDVVNTSCAHPYSTVVCREEGLMYWLSTNVFDWITLSSQRMTVTWLVVTLRDTMDRPSRENPRPCELWAHQVHQTRTTQCNGAEDLTGERCNDSDCVGRLVTCIDAVRSRDGGTLARERRSLA